MSKSFKDWYSSVVTHYGDFTHFDDAHSVRIMRQRELEMIAEHESISKEIEDSAMRADYDQTFADDIAEAKANVELCDKWLIGRGLKP